MAAMFSLDTGCRPLQRTRSGSECNGHSPCSWLWLEPQAAVDDVLGAVSTADDERRGRSHLQVRSGSVVRHGAACAELVRGSAVRLYEPQGVSTATRGRHLAAAVFEGSTTSLSNEAVSPLSSLVLPNEFTHRVCARPGKAAPGVFTDVLNDVPTTFCGRRKQAVR